MGELNQHDLSRFDCSVFIETGTGKAVGTSHAVSYPQFKQLHTIEKIPLLHEYSKSTIKDPRLTFHLGDSVEVLKSLLLSISTEDKILYWLDAHFPGADYQLAPYTFDDDSMPLKRELSVILELRGVQKDSFIIDDLQLYEDGPFQFFNPNLPIKKSGIGFLEDIFSSTHRIQRDYRHQGFLIVTPV